MNRRELEEYIASVYRVQAEYPWPRYPGYMVFRRRENQKWFAVVMDLRGDKLGMEKDKIIDVVNLKCDPLMIGSLRLEDGFYPAYHMSKANWITAALDGRVEEEKLKFLLDLSFALTKKNK